MLFGMSNDLLMFGRECDNISDMSETKISTTPKVRTKTAEEMREYDLLTEAMEAEYAAVPLPADKRKLIDDMVVEAHKAGRRAARVADQEGRVSAEAKAIMNTDQWKSQSRRLDIETKLTWAYLGPEIEKPADSLLLDH